MLTADLDCIIAESSASPNYLIPVVLRPGHKYKQAYLHPQTHLDVCLPLPSQHSEEPLQSLPGADTHITLVLKTDACQREGREQGAEVHSGNEALLKI